MNQYIQQMELKTKFQHTVIDFIKNDLVETKPAVCIAKKGIGKTTALVFASLDVEESVVVLCPGKMLSETFLSKVRDVINKRGQSYKGFNEDRIRINDNKSIYAYPVGQETWDVHIDDDVGYVFFDDAHFLHPLVTKRLVTKLNNKKIAITTNHLISELQGVVKVRITNN